MSQGDKNRPKLKCRKCGRFRAREEFLLRQNRWISYICKACRRAYESVWKSKNQDKVRLYRKNHYAKKRTSLEKVIKQLYWSVRSRCKKLRFNLSSQYLLRLFRKQKGLCALSGIPLSHGGKSGRGYAKPFTLSLDRIFPKRGYVKGNVRFLGLWINVMRYSRSDSDLINVCKLIAKHNGDKQ